MGALRSMRAWVSCWVRGLVRWNLVQGCNRFPHGDCRVLFQDSFSDLTRLERRPHKNGSYLRTADIRLFLFRFRVIP